MQPTKNQVFAVRSESGAWKQLAVVMDAQVAWIELVPAYLYGWNVKREWRDVGDSWPDMTWENIVAWKQASGYPFEPATDEEAAWAIARVASWTPGSIA